jgi:hypothetical protein
MSWIEGDMTFTANGALGANVRVKITAGSTTDPPQVEVAGAGEEHIGITKFAVASGGLVTIRSRKSPGIHEVAAAGAFAVGAALYGAAAGKVDDVVSGAIIGYAVEAATADGDIVKIVDHP